ncbi:MAG: T9SS type A sorting domain-containing protein [candidate division Zixibacteria bacterium]|nr:T9SS type A sorting domain-containing protein [candidate division Zixibacteria bacterium]
MRYLVLFALTFILFLSPTVYAQNWLYVVNSLAETISRVNLDNGNVQNHIATVGSAPNDIKIHDYRAYILNSISDNIHIFNIESQTVEGTIEFHRSGNPWEMLFADNGYAYVTNFVNGQLYEVDVNSGNIVRDFQVGATLEGIYIAAGKLFVTDVNYNPGNYTYGDGILYYSDLNDLSDWGQLAIGTNPQKIIMGPDGNLHIVCTGNYVDIMGSIYVVNPETVQEVTHFNIGGSPGPGMAVSGELVFIGAGGWVDNGIVFCYNGNTYEILNDSNNPITVGTGAMGITSDNNGNAYSCNFNAATISKISQSRQVIDTYNVGDGPNCAAFYNPQTGIDDDIPLPKSTELAITAYPNPFNSSTTVGFEGVTMGTDLTVKVYDLQGTLVDKIDMKINPDYDKINWNANDLSSGIYFLRAGNYGNYVTKKITLIK